MIITRRFLSFFVIVLIIGLLTMPRSPVVASTQLDIVGPAGSGAFGTNVIVLSSGNFVVTDPYYDDGSIVDVGAVYLYDGRSGELISMLTGSTADNRVGRVVTPLTNGNYVVVSPFWDNGEVVSAGAVTWGDGATGVAGVVSAANSLVGTSAGDGWTGVIALTNGNYVVCSPWWDNGVVKDAGAVTWGDGTSGVTGEVSAANSLVGSNIYDQIGHPNFWIGIGAGVIALTNGNYVVRSPYWDNDEVLNAGAVTWGNGNSGITGVVSDANSLVGGTADDLVGSYNVTALANGNYVVSSNYWDNAGIEDAGAVTWGDGGNGTTGLVSAANSLVGSSARDLVGDIGLELGGVTALANGNYVVSSLLWDNAGVEEAGAVTWGDGAIGVVGEVSAANSLVGTSAHDLVGEGGVTALSNGNYVVVSPFWDDTGVTDGGAITWGDGTAGVTGMVSAANSLVGSSGGDTVGEFGVVALTNGNYVVPSPAWDNAGVEDAGAATWGDGASGTTGEVSAANSLVGSSADDLVSLLGVIALTNGNYVVSSPDWDYGTITDAGAATSGDGASGTTGEVSAANSLVGSSADDSVSLLGVIALTNGNYVVPSPAWDNGGVVDAGAVTWGDGANGTTGVVSAANSLVGSSAGDLDGYDVVVALANGNYVVLSSYWDNGGVVDAGAVTWGDGANGTTGVVSAANSLVGGSTDDVVGSWGVTALDNGSYVVISPWWDNAGMMDAGAVSWGDGNYPATGLITADNSVRGTTAGGGPNLNFAYDEVNQQLVVGRPADNIVTLFHPSLPPVNRSYSVHLPVILNQESP